TVTGAIGAQRGPVRAIPAGDVVGPLDSGCVREGTADVDPPIHARYRRDVMVQRTTGSGGAGAEGMPGVAIPARDVVGLLQAARVGERSADVHVGSGYEDREDIGVECGLSTHAFRDLRPGLSVPARKLRRRDVAPDVGEPTAHVEDSALERQRGD